MTPGAGDRAVGPSSGRRSKPNLLFLCQTLPYPPDGGVHNRTYNVARLLADAFEVTSLCFYRSATRSDGAAVSRGTEGMAAFGAAESFPIPQEHDPLRRMWDHVRSTVARRVYTRFVYESREFAQRVRSLVESGEIDLVHLDSLDLSGYAGVFTGHPIVCTHHNCEHELLRRRAAATRNPLASAYLRYQARLTEREAREWCPRFDLNLVVSEADRLNLHRLAPTADYLVVENGVDVKYFRPRATDDPGDPADRSRRLVFVGGHSWYPNRDGMEYFCTEILPLVRRRIPDLEVTWVGRTPESVRADYARRFGVRATGYVDDVRPYVHRAGCYIVPLRIGGGTRVKIVDAWAMGSAVVSTGIGCEGLATRPGENILVEDEPTGFADAVVRVLDDRDLRRTLEAGGRTTAEARYAWPVIGRRLVDGYRRVLTRRGG